MNKVQLKKSLHYAFRGLSRVWKEEQNFRIQLGVALCVMILAFVARLPFSHMLILLATICVVLVLECINTVFETMTDLLKPRISEQVKYIKDIMAGVVLVASFFSVFVGVFVFLPFLRQIIHFLFEYISIL